MGYKIYGKKNCAGCDQAKALLDSKGFGYHYIDVMSNPAAQIFFKEKGFRSVPQVFFEETLIGSFEELKTFLGE